MKVLLIVLISLLTCSASATLTIKDFVGFAEKNDPRFQKIIKDRDKLSFLVDLGLPSRKATVEVGQEYGFDTGDEGDTSIFSGAVSKEIIESGTKLSISHTKTSRPDREEDVTEFRIEQDLYKNLLGRDVRLKKSALKDEEEIVRLQVLESYEEYLVEILGQYLDYQKSFLDHRLAEVALQDALTLRKNISQKRQLRVATHTDVDKGELQVLLRKEDLLNKRKEWHVLQESLRSIVGGKMPETPSQKAVVLGEVRRERKEAQPRAVQVAVLQEQISNKNLQLSKRAGDPSLSLVGGYDIDNSERFSSVVNRNQAVIGISFEMPFGDTQAKAQEKSILLERAQAQLNLKVLKQSLAQEKNELKVQMNELKEKIVLGEKKTRLMEKILKAEELRYSYGKIDLDQLIELKSDLLEFRFQHQADVLEYNKTYLNWLALNDQLIHFKDFL